MTPFDTAKFQLSESVLSIIYPYIYIYIFVIKYNCLFRLFHRVYHLDLEYRRSRLDSFLQKNLLETLFINLYFINAGYEKKR